MSQAVPGLLSFVMGCAFVLLGRWGARNGEGLVSTAIAAPRREREIRSIRRGSRSCVLLGTLLGLAGIALAISGAHP